MSRGDLGPGRAPGRAPLVCSQVTRVDMARKTQQVEVRMVSEYLLHNYAEFPFTMAVPLGSLPVELLATVGQVKTMGVMRPYRPEVDAMVVLPRYLLLVEAKVWNVLNGLAKLPMYKSLVPITPELRQYMPREIIMELVVGWTNPNLERMARDAGVTVRVFCPPWLNEVVNKLHDYWTGPARAERGQKLAMRQYFGVD